MQATATTFKAENTVSNGRQHNSTATYKKVLDKRKHAIRGLWERNGRYYAQISVEDAVTGVKRVKRVPLEGAATNAQAVAKFQELLVQRAKGTLPVLHRTPKFVDYAEQYFQYYEQVKDAKRASTLYTERIAINHWSEHLGQVRLDKITRALVNGYIAKRQALGMTGRTVNLEVTCFRNVMKRAIDDNIIQRLPTENLRPLKWTPKKRELVTPAEIEKLCDSALKTSRNGQEFSDYIRLMAYCGARMSESLRLRWSDVDWNQRQLTIGSDGLSKNHKARVVDFNPQLEAVLKDMLSRKAPDTAWLFPSPQRGGGDRAAKTFRESLLIARKEAGVPKFGFHDCRHFFISMCVMSGIDFMTIAKWVGHQDGGILIGKVYGHLSNEHAQLQAQRVNFGPSVLPPMVALRN
ncbi:MAG TPA: tyrosine-type recombinase/integrase [Verrucomicrobiae bacterium]|jgi:integrase|nr:tyrosine-type recombinase/integrase [Verrucomicrobiae bacterium]